jgi:hypothetical protein
LPLLACCGAGGGLWVAHCWVLREQARPLHPVGVGAVLCLSDGSMPVVIPLGSSSCSSAFGLAGWGGGFGWVAWWVWGVRGVFENWIADASI